MKKILRHGEQKSIQTDRIVLAPGPVRERSIVQEIYTLFTKERKTEPQIAALLNDRGVRRDVPRPWTRDCIQRMLTNPNYIGVNVFNRASVKLGQNKIRNPPEMWVSRPHAFEAIISPEQFAQAQAIFQQRRERTDAEAMLAKLRLLLARRGKVSAHLIDAEPGMPCTAVYIRIFGSLANAYKLIGYALPEEFAHSEVSKAIRRAQKQHSAYIAEILRHRGVPVEVDVSKGLLTINHELTAVLILARCRRVRNREIHWSLSLPGKTNADIVIVARLDPNNKSVRDYYFFPDIANLEPRVRLSPQNAMLLDACRSPDLEPLIRTSRRVKLMEVI